MYRLVLVLVLVAVTASEQHVKAERRNGDDWDTCYGKNDPIPQCYWKDNSSYPTISDLRRARGYQGIKRVVMGEGVLEKLCGEGQRIGTCISSAIRRAPAHCQKNYVERHLTSANLDKAVALIQELCTKENLEIATRHLDCVVDECILQKLYPCSLKNPDHDCSHLESNDYGPNSARRECYDEMYLRNCDAEEVVECAAKKVSKACGAELGPLITQAGNGAFDIMPICRDREHKFRTLLKLFK